MNRVFLIGRLTKDPEVRYTPQQMAVAHFTLAVDRVTKGEKKADFIKVVAFDKTAENIQKYVFKGSQVAVEGSIRTGSYKDKDGKTVYTTDINADRVEFMSRSETPAPQAEFSFSEASDDIPW